MSQNPSIFIRYCFHPSTLRGFYEDIDITGIVTFVLGGLRQAIFKDKGKYARLIGPKRHLPGSGRRTIKTKKADQTSTAYRGSALAQRRQGTTAFKMCLEGQPVAGCEIHGSAKDQKKVH